MKVLCKFACNDIAINNDDDPNANVSVRLYAVTDGSQENETFWKYTPAGTIEIDVCNASAADFFVPGEEYYVSFQRAEAE